MVSQRDDSSVGHSVLETLIVEMRSDVVDGRRGHVNRTSMVHGSGEWCDVDSAAMVGRRMVGVNDDSGSMVRRRVVPVMRVWDDDCGSMVRRMMHWVVHWCDDCGVHWMVSVMSVVWVCNDHNAVRIVMSVMSVMMMVHCV